MRYHPLFASLTGTLFLAGMVSRPSPVSIRSGNSARYLFARRPRCVGHLGRLRYLRHSGPVIAMSVAVDNLISAIKTHSPQ